MVGSDENIDPNTGLPYSGLSSSTSASKTTVSSVSSGGGGGASLTLVWVLVGSAIAVAGYAAVFWALYNFAQIGTCASGGPYVSARECPADMPYYVLALLGGLAVQGVGRLIIPGAIRWARGFIAADGYIAMGIAVYLGSHTAAAAEVSGTDSIGTVFAIVLFVVGAIRMLFALKSMSGSKTRSTLAVTGERVRARVTQVDPTGITVNGQPRWNVSVEASINGVTQTFKKAAYTRPDMEPKVGEHVWLTYDPRKPEKHFAIGSVDRPSDPLITIEAQERQAANRPPSSTLNPPPVVAVPTSSTGTSTGDPVEKLKQLTQMRDAGLITPSEFDLKKSEILNEL